METAGGIIAAHPFTAGFNSRFLRLLSEDVRVERFAAEQQIFRESFEADRFYLVQNGRVALQTFVRGGGLTTIQTIGAGEALGWSWLYPPHRWHFTAVAVEPVEAASLCAGTLRRRMEEDCEFGYQVAIRVGELMLERLQATRLRLLEMYGTPG